MIAASLALAVPACALSLPGSLAAWGSNSNGQCNVPAGNDFVAVAGGSGSHGLALRSNGSVAAWGYNTYGQCNVPAGNDFVAVAAGGLHSLALRSNGSVAAWGVNASGQCKVPAGNSYVAVAAGDTHSLALRSDGSVAAWGANDYGQCNVPAGNDFVAIAAGLTHSLGIRSDGSLVAWGWWLRDVPAGNDFVAIDAGNYHSLALRSNGSLVAWGNNGYGQCNVPAGNDFVAITAGDIHSLALRSDGSLVAWGNNGNGQCNVPAGNDFVAIAGGYSHSFAIRSAGHYAVTVSVPGGHGRAVPATQEVPGGMSVPVLFIHDPGYHVATVTDNGDPVSPANRYWIGNVSRDHDIVVSFAPNTQTVTGITPASGRNGEILGDVNITGTNFSSGMTVNLTAYGLPNITGADIRVSGGGTSLLCNLSLAGAEPGSRTVVVTNPAGFAVIGPSFFDVLWSDLPVNVTSITPASGKRGKTVKVTNLSGSGFLPGAKTSLVKGTRKIPGKGITVVNDTVITCTFKIPATAAIGKWDVNVTNPYGQSGVKQQAFAVKA